MYFRNLYGENKKPHQHASQQLKQKPFLCPFFHVDFLCKMFDEEMLLSKP